MEEIEIIIIDEACCLLQESLGNVEPREADKSVAQALGLLESLIIMMIKNEEKGGEEK